MQQTQKGSEDQAESLETEIKELKKKVETQ